MTLAYLVNALLVLQRPSTGSQGAHCRASPARQEQRSWWQVWDVLGGDAGRDNSISKTRQKAGTWAGAGPGQPATVKTTPYQCCIPEHLSQNRHRACLIPANCGRASIATGLWRGLQWLLLGHCSLPGPPDLLGWFYSWC